MWIAILVVAQSKNTYINKSQLDWAWQRTTIESECFSVFSLSIPLYRHTRKYDDECCWWVALHRRVYTQKLLRTDAFTHTGAFTQRSFYTERLLDAEAFTHRGFYTEKPLHRGAFRHKGVYTQKLLHTDAVTQRSLYTEALTHRRVYRQKLLHKEVFTQRAFTHGSFHTQTFLHREAFTQRSLYTEVLLHEVERWNWQQFSRKNPSQELSGTSLPPLAPSKKPQFHDKQHKE